MTKLLGYRSDLLTIDVVSPSTLPTPRELLQINQLCLLKSPLGTQLLPAPQLHLHPSIPAPTSLPACSAAISLNNVNTPSSSSALPIPQRYPGRWRELLFFWFLPLHSLPGETEAQRGQGLHTLQRGPVSHGVTHSGTRERGRRSIWPQTLPRLITEPLSSSWGVGPLGENHSPTFIPASCSFSFLLQSRCRWR